MGRGKDYSSPQWRAAPSPPHPSINQNTTRLATRLLHGSREQNTAATPKRGMRRRLSTNRPTSEQTLDGRSGDVAVSDSPNIRVCRQYSILRYTCLSTDRDAIVPPINRERTLALRLPERTHRKNAQGLPSLGAHSVRPRKGPPVLPTRAQDAIDREALSRHACTKQIYGKELRIALWHPSSRTAKSERSTHACLGGNIQAPPLG